METSNPTGFREKQINVVSLADVGFLASHRRCGPSISIQQLFSPQPTPNLHDCEGPAVRHLTACLPEHGNVLQDPHAQIDHCQILVAVSCTSQLHVQHDQQT